MIFTQVLLFVFLVHKRNYRGIVIRHFHLHHLHSFHQFLKERQIHANTSFLYCHCFSSSLLYTVTHLRQLLVSRLSITSSSNYYFIRQKELKEIALDGDCTSKNSSSSLHCPLTPGALFPLYMLFLVIGMDVHFVYNLVIAYHFLGEPLLHQLTSSGMNMHYQGIIFTTLLSFN